MIQIKFQIGTLDWHLVDNEIEGHEELRQTLEYYRKKCKILEEEVAKYRRRETPERKIFWKGFRHCPICDYVVDNKVPSQNYCDRCGQRLWKEGATHART